MTEKKHDRIFLQVCDDEDSEWCDEVTWCEDRIHPDDVEYIRADLVVEQLAAKDAALYNAARKAAVIAMEKCKNATGQRKKIEMYVSANQIAEDVVAAIDKELK
jgi:hypothetical protein